MTTTTATQSLSSTVLGPTVASLTTASSIALSSTVTTTTTTATTTTSAIRSTATNSAATILTATTSTAITANNATTSSTSKSNGVSPGTVAGVTLGVGIGLALLAALVTFLFMRRQVVRRSSGSQNQRQYEPSKRNSGKTQIKPALVVFDDHLPQPADDKTVQTKTKTFFDQVELFVENFCQVKPSSGAKVATAELTAFNSPHLSKPLAFSLPRAKDVPSLIKHSLARYTTSRISPAAATEDTLLPADLALLDGAATVNASKPGFTKYLSRWRVVTAYIRPDPSSDRTYIADRDRKIAQSVQNFMQAFAPWMNTKYNEQDRAQALTAIFQEAAELGIFLLSQPSELVFQWPRENHLDPGRLAITPALVKLTDEYGQILGQAQVLVGAPMADF